MQKWKADDINSEGKVMVLISDRTWDFGDVALWRTIQSGLEINMCVTGLRVTTETLKINTFL